MFFINISDPKSSSNPCRNILPMLDSQKKKVKNRKRPHQKVKENSSLRPSSLRNSDMHKSPISSNAEDSISNPSSESLPSKRSCVNFVKASPKSAHSPHSTAHFLGQSTALEVEITSEKAAEPPCTKTENFNDEIDSILSAIDLDKSFDKSPNPLDCISSEIILPPVDVGLGLCKPADLDVGLGLCNPADLNVGLGLCKTDDIDVSLCVDDESDQRDDSENAVNQDSSSGSDSRTEIAVNNQFDSGFVSESNDFPLESTTIEDVVITDVPVIDSYPSNIFPNLETIENAPLEEDSDTPKSLPTLDFINDLPEESGVLLSHMKETLKAITEKIPASKPEFVVETSLSPENQFLDPQSQSEDQASLYQDQEEGPPRLLDPHGVSISHDLSSNDPNSLPRISLGEDLSEDQPWSLENEELSNHPSSVAEIQSSPVHQPTGVEEYRDLEYQDHKTPEKYPGFSTYDPFKFEDVSEEEIDVEASYPSTLKLKRTSGNQNNIRIASVAERDNLPSSPGEHSKVILRIKRTYSGFIYSSTDPFHLKSHGHDNHGLKSQGLKSHGSKTRTKKCDSSKPVKSFSHSSSCRYKKKKSKHKKLCRHHRRSNEERKSHVKVLRRNSPNSYEVYRKDTEEKKYSSFSEYLKRVGEVKYKRIKLKYGLNSSLNIDIPPKKHKKVS